MLSLGRSSAECKRTQAGHEYMGTLSLTVSGRQCQAWSSNTPHVPSSEFTDDTFPDGSRAAARNYCRNPQQSWTSGVWCYTTDPSTSWESCDVPLCVGKSAVYGLDCAITGCAESLLGLCIHASVHLLFTYLLT